MNTATMIEEINALEKLIEKREAWLADPTNIRRGTYKAIKSDTAQLKTKRAALHEKLSNKHFDIEAVC